MWPWDVDLSFGRRWISSLTYWDQRLITNTPLFVGNNNRLPQTIFSISEMRQMYLRRIRTLMDELLKLPGTPVEELHYEPRIDELAARIAADAALDAAEWNSHAWGNGSTIPCCPQSLFEAAEEIKTFYLPERRDQLYNGLASGASEIPDAQPPGTIVVFGAVEANPVGGNQDEEYIQLLNPNGSAVDISGWTLNAGPAGRTRIFTFRGGTVIPAGGSVYVAANRPAFRARAAFPTGGMGLFVVGDYSDRLSARGEPLVLTDRQGVNVAWTSTPSTPSTPQSFLRVTEIMYNPPALPDDTFQTQEYEYLELKNIGTATLNLLGVHFAEGITFMFSRTNVPTLAAEQHLLVVKNRDAFIERYGEGYDIAGEYAGFLDNGGERIRLEDAKNEEILDFDYDDFWYPLTDGAGFSLVIADADAPFDTWSNPGQWRLSTTEGGSPGTEE
jgi:hypothetical protein